MEAGEVGITRKEKLSKAPGLQFLEKEIQLRNGESIVLPSMKIDQMTLYHGSRVSGIRQFRGAEETTVGEGLYLTSDPEKARGYAIVRSKEKIDPFVYETEITDMNIVNLSTESAINSFAKLFHKELLTISSDLIGKNLAWNSYAYFLRDKALERAQKIYEDKFRGLKDIISQLGSVATALLMKENFDGLMTIEGGEYGNGHKIGDHDSYVIFQPERTKIIREDTVEHYR